MSRNAVPVCMKAVFTTSGYGKISEVILVVAAYQQQGCELPSLSRVAHGAAVLKHSPYNAFFLQSD